MNSIGTDVNWLELISLLKGLGSCSVTVEEGRGGTLAGFEPRDVTSLWTLQRTF